MVSNGPMPFADLIGQERATAPLRAALAKGALHHAYLFGGPEGVGKATAARALAMAANCEKPVTAQDGLPDACGKCGPCRKITRDVHPDVLFIAEERAMAKAGRWEPKAGRAPSKDIVVDQVRDIVDRRLSLRRVEGMRRFVVLDPADRMNLQAQNAFLKTLEEPPEGTTLVLVAANPDALLPTIRSRCLRVSFAPLAAATVEAKLVARGLEPGEARLGAALCGGSLGKALALDKDALLARRSALEEAAALGPGDARAWIRFAKVRGEGDREAARDICELLLVWLRDVLAFQSGARELALRDLAPLTEKTAREHVPEEILRRGEWVKEAIARFENNPQPALLLERLFLGWFHG